MTPDQLLAWIKGEVRPACHCYRCGKPQIVCYRDVDEKPVGMCCLNDAAFLADVDTRRIRRRMLQLSHDCPAEGCQTCMEQDA